MVFSFPGYNITIRMPGHYRECGYKKVRILSGTDYPGFAGHVGWSIPGIPGKKAAAALVIRQSQAGQEKGARMSLKEALEEFKQGVLTKLPREDLALMDEGTEALIRSGIVAGAKKVGEVAPDFTLPNTNGEPLSLSALLAQGPVVVTFYRGVW
jgi:hypothetical protein